MRLLPLLLLCILSKNVLSQNVGINNPSPAERLDVNGNINVTGTIKANGTDGAAGQVLMKNSSGNLQWSDLSNYKNFTTYYFDGSFTVPAGVTKIAVELWGAGGGGNGDASGGGGGYIMAVLNVTPGAIATIDIGTGGTGTSFNSAQGGGNTTFSIGAVNLNAGGGFGAQYITATSFLLGAGGMFPVFIPGVNTYIGAKGFAGSSISRNFTQVNATTFYETIDGANGGHAWNAPEAAGKAGRMIWNITGSAIIQFVNGDLNGSSPGGGGASGFHYTTGVTTGGNGGDGLVIVRY